MNNLYVLPILLFSIVIHEIAHGLMALKLGDTTARDAGRLTLNPIPHIDLIGSIIIPLLSFVTTGSVFIAWAKPVPVNPMNFTNRRRDDILVSAVGPISNFIVALACALFYVLSVRAVGLLEQPSDGIQLAAATFFTNMFAAGITLNVFLAVFNLIPVPPLDGSHVLSSLLPPHIGERYRQVGFLGILIVIVLMRVDLFRNAVYFIVSTLRVPYLLIIQYLQ